MEFNINDVSIAVGIYLFDNANVKYNISDLDIGNMDGFGIGSAAINRIIHRI